MTFSYIAVAFFAFILGIVAGVLITRFWEEITDRIEDMRDEYDPDEAAQRRVRAVSWLRRNLWWIAMLAFVLLIILVISFAGGEDARTVTPLDGFVTVQDKCGNTHNVQIQPAHVQQGFILVAPGTECELPIPVAPNE